MNDLTPIPHGHPSGHVDNWHTPVGIPAAVEAPEFHEATGALGATIRSYFRGNGADADSATVAEARHHLRRIAPLCDAATDAKILHWLAQMATGVANAPATREEAGVRCQPLVEACRGFPIAVWSDDVKLAFWKAHRWWPQPADLFAFLEPYAKAIRRQRAGCEAVIVQRDADQAGALAPEAELTADQRKMIGAEFRRRALVAIAEGASLLNTPSAAATRKPIVRTRTDDFARLGMLKARAANASSEPIRRACAQTARELEARLMGGEART